MCLIGLPATLDDDHVIALGELIGATNRMVGVQYDDEVPTEVVQGYREQLQLIVNESSPEQRVRVISKK